jgi:hypothetical protein
MPLKPLIDEVKVGKKVEQFVNSSDCSICNARNKDGADVRLNIDRYLITHEIKDVIPKLLEEYNLKVTLGDLKKHLESHSAWISNAKNYVLKTAEKLALSKLHEIEEVYIDADDVIQDIITIGGKKIRNEEINVDAKLLLGALKEQGTRKKVGSLQQMFTELDKSRFIQGEVIETIKPEEEVPLIPNVK